MYTSFDPSITTALFNRHQAAPKRSQQLDLVEVRLVAILKFHALKNPWSHFCKQLTTVLLSTSFCILDGFSLVDSPRRAFAFNCLPSYLRFGGN